MLGEEDHFPLERSSSIFWLTKKVMTLIMVMTTIHSKGRWERGERDRMGGQSSENQFVSS